jgi:hypothetical protein
MATKTFIVKFKPPELGLQSVQAATAEIHDEHLVLLDSNGRLAAFFLLDNVDGPTGQPSAI